MPLILIVAADPGDVGPPANLTEATKKVFADNVGKPVVIEGQLGVGKLGYSLRRSAKSEEVMFQVIPPMPAKGLYRFPKSWDQYLDQTVRVSGTLKFRPARRAPPDPTRATLPDLYFLEIQDSTIEPAHGRFDHLVERGTSSVAKSDDAIYPFDEFFSHAFGKSYSVRVTDELLSKSPKWLEASQHPPVSPRKALAAADALAKELVGVQNHYRRYLEGITLKPIKNGWVWLVKFDWIFDGSATGIPDNLIVVVTMDGKVIRPEIAELGKKAPPSPR